MLSRGIGVVAFQTKRLRIGKVEEGILSASSYRAPLSCVHCALQPITPAPGVASSIALLLQRGTTIINKTIARWAAPAIHNQYQSGMAAIGIKRSLDAIDVDASDSDNAVPQCNEIIEEPQRTEGANKHNSGGGKQFKRKQGRRKKIVENSHTRQESLESEELSKTIHPGSYANSTQRRLFGVELPLTSNEHSASKEGDIQRSKKKVAFLLGYLGTNYSGFQINEGKRTLQGEFELALLRCGFLDHRNFGYPHKYSWSTSGRTDKGVHACAQVCSCKIELLPDQTSDQVRDAMNEVLPKDFRVLDVIRTTRGFCAKTQRSRVRYQYMIPSCVLLSDLKTLHDAFSHVHSTATVSERQLADPLSSQEVSQVKSVVDSHRVSSQELERLRAALKCFEGTHSFHNFTKGVSTDEARATRYIESFQVGEPILFNETEWVPTSVLGQSFLLHQIRKMICMAIDVSRGAVPIETIARALSKESMIRVGLAPAQGLFLEMSYYGSYNRRKQQNPDLKDVDWDDETSEVHGRWKSFRNEVVMKHVMSEEDNGNFVKFLYLQEWVFDKKTGYQLEEDSS